MIDIESTVFNRIADIFDAKYPKGSRYGESVTSPPRFPCLTIEMVDNYTYQGSLDAEHKEHNAWVVFEVNVYSNLTMDSKQQCKAILDMVDTELQSLNFVRLFSTPGKNAGKKYSRVTARYRAVVSEDYIIYRR